MYIGKEANKVEMQELESNKVETYIDFKTFHESALSLEPKDAREWGLWTGVLKRTKDKIKQVKKLNYGKGALKVLVENFFSTISKNTYTCAS